MTKHMEDKFPPLGREVALWSDPDHWYADVVTLERFFGGDVRVRLVRSAEPRLDNHCGREDLVAKILKNGCWILRGVTCGKGKMITVEGRDWSIDAERAQFAAVRDKELGRALDREVADAHRMHRKAPVWIADYSRGGHLTDKGEAVLRPDLRVRKVLA